MNLSTAARPNALNRATRQAGSSLLEVLVAILLVSVVLLGIAGLTSATFSYNKAAQLRLTGLALANDYADRARVNVYGFDSLGYTIKLDDSIPAAGTLAGEESNALTAATAMAKSDRNYFMTEVAARLPQGKAVVASSPSATARTLDVWLLWKEPQVADVKETDDAKGYAAFSLFKQGQDNCPKDLSDDDKALYSCMYFKVGL